MEDAYAISIHALREEGDRPSMDKLGCHRYFYPRPPRGGRPPILRACLVRCLFLSTPSARRATEGGRTMNITVKFLSTPSARRATFRAGMLTCWKCYFYPRPPRGGRRLHAELDRQLGIISIHALREEGDGRCFAKAYSARLFLSTPSARRATQPLCGVGARSFDFYPRPPRGGRLCACPFGAAIA